MSVPSDPNLTRQPSTLDSRTELPDDPPRAIGHDDDRAGEVRDAIDTHKQAVQEASEGPEVGPRSPGDHAGGEEEGDDDDEVPEGTVADVKAWVGDDPDRARRALEAERAGPDRATLVTYLEGF
jgi:hypothetical protein